MVYNTKLNVHSDIYIIFISIYCKIIVFLYMYIYYRYTYFMKFNLYEFGEE